MLDPEPKPDPVVAAAEGTPEFVAEYKQYKRERDRFYAAMVASDPPIEWMMHVCNTDRPYEVGGLEICERIATWKVMQADALLSALDKGTP